MSIVISTEYVLNMHPTDGVDIGRSLKMRSFKKKF